MLFPFATVTVLSCVPETRKMRTTMKLTMMIMLTTIMLTTGQTSTAMVVVSPGWVVVVVAQSRSRSGR